MPAPLPPPSAAPAGLPGPDPVDLLWVGADPVDRRGRVVVRVIGEVDDYTAPLLESCLRGQSGRAAVHTLVVDVSRVRFLSCAGVAVLAGAAQRCADRGARLVVRPGSSSIVHRVLQLGVPQLLVQPAATRPAGPTGRGRPRTGAPGTRGPRRTRGVPGRSSHIGG